VRTKTELTNAFDAATSEAQSSFGSSDLIAERYLERARHIEVQVLGDGTGGVQLFFERDCSTQRRLQKLLEETPSPAVTSSLREKLLLTAGRAISTARYRGAGTLEFLLSEEGELFFLEMNTRIQVEHPVTEVTTGIDLIAEQIAIAQGKKLAAWKNDLSVSVVEPRGAAMEFRLNAEDPERDFQPSMGKLTALDLPFGPRVRVDSGVEVGDEITPYYDSLLAKVIAWGPGRTEALETLLGALKETRVRGVMSTAPLGVALLADAGFLEGKNHCQYVAERLADESFLSGARAEEDLPLIAAAAAWLHRQQSRKMETSARTLADKGTHGDLSPWAQLQRNELRE
jgi:acetyl-CoA carboxylase biotin carboxylase subunit